MTSVVRTRLLATTQEILAGEQRAWAARYDVAPISSLVPRSRARVAGVLRSVTYAPAGAVTALRAELYDGTGSIDLVWTGRRDVPGIVAGRRLLATGTVARSEPGRSRPAIHNPVYDLLPAGEEHA
ncbi:OB-fold nucleic acid binding domain-containing protein [Litorihabitans aurantiacus]|uniref:DNA-binding protein n=1 Tax=Litorihabitans aurantiacus TaxID=1930061 RepID=A0AA38CNR1_9MICO|nr:OB-fold nucleic acid binding domain-containing protein [Litorihabitans aurantiacus]GMA31448.1 hypothetical protein GCM10025875_14400 [Litorihabitans aurantiacus]